MTKTIADDIYEKLDGILVKESITDEYFVVFCNGEKISVKDSYEKYKEYKVAF